MKKRGIYKDKTAQFYLIAAIIIVVMIIGLSTVSNYIITREEPVKFYDLSENFDLESSYVVDYGMAQEEDIPLLVNNWTETIASYAEGEINDFVVIQGDETGATATTYTTQETGGVTVVYGENTYTFLGNADYVPETQPLTPTTTEQGTNVQVSLLGNNYNFKMKKGQNFFFVITKKTKEETHIKTR